MLGRGGGVYLGKLKKEKKREIQHLLFPVQGGVEMTRFTLTIKTKHGKTQKYGKKHERQKKR